MMNFEALSEAGIAGERIDTGTALRMLEDTEVPLLPLINSAFEVRKAHCGMGVTVHILNNAKNGNCPEDCKYCAQGQSADPDAIEDYPMKSDEEILAEADRAHQAGAHRYCMVFAGRGPSDRRVDHLASLIQEIKNRYALEVCVSPGLLKEGQAERLKEAGLDRLNHNLNTTESNYGEICETHGFKDRLQTLSYARDAGLEVCSGMILGMGEGPQGAVEVLNRLADLKAKSIPVNFLVPVPGVSLGQPETLTPEYCLRVLCVARFLNPKAEIRAAGGREHHLRSLQAMALYPANSVFMDGYLNVVGNQQIETLKMIRDTGFEIVCDDAIDINSILSDNKESIMKGSGELHPTLSVS